MPSVTLNREEAKVASSLAKLRWQKCQDRSANERKRGPQSDEVTDLNGVLAEIALAKYFNLWPHEAFTAGGADLRLPGGVTLDVKGTEYEDGHLLATLEKRAKNAADAFVLAIIEKGEDSVTVTFPGWMKSEDLLREEMEDYFGHGYVYAASQSDLHPMNELKEL